MSRRKSRIRNVCRPGGIVHQPRGILFGFKIEQLGELHFHAGDVVVQNLLCEQLPLGGFAARITNGTGRAARDGNRMMAEQLKSSQRQQRNQIAHVQAVRRRVKTAVKRNWCGHAFGQFRRVGAIGHKAAPFEFFQSAHPDRLNCRWRIANGQLKLRFLLIVATVTGVLSRGMNLPSNKLAQPGALITESPLHDLKVLIPPRTKSGSATAKCQSDDAHGRERIFSNVALSEARSVAE